MPEAAATFRHSYGVSLWTAGTDSLPWVEAVQLTQAALADPATQLGAACAKWSYPATMQQVIALEVQAAQLQITKPKDLAKILPFDPSKKPKATKEEKDRADAIIAASVIFA